MSLQGCFGLFLGRCEDENLSPATIQFYMNNMDRFVRFLADEHNLSNPLIKDFQVEYIKQYLLKIKNSAKWESHSTIRAKGKVGSQSVKTYTRALRSVGNWFFEQGYIKENILEKVELPKASKTQKEVLDDSEIEACLNVFNTKTELGLRNTIIFVLSFDLGIRQGGISSLTISDVDLKRQTIRVRLKGGDITILPAGNTVIRLIREYVLKYREFADLDSPLLINTGGKKLTENAIKKMFTKLKKVTGIAKLHCHIGRHTFSTNYVRGGRHSIKELQLALAHSTDTMAKEYVHLEERINYIRGGADSYFDSMQERTKKVPLKGRHKRKNNRHSE